MSRTGPSTKKLNRRQYLKTAAAAGAACFMPTIIPASALGRGGAVAPSERIVLGGHRPRGPRRVRPEVDAAARRTCNSSRSATPGRSAARPSSRSSTSITATPTARCIPRCASSSRPAPDIDAVLIATGDRWHSLATIMAMRAGKDVYSEKPSCMTIAEGREVVETARRYGRIYQTGVQRLSEATFVIAIELARSGRLGQVHTVRAHIAPWDAAEMSHAWLPEEPQPPKEEVDWDAWLGPCPWRPYNSTYVKGGWRGHYDFHTSCIGEWGAHTFAQSQAGIDALQHLGRRVPLREERHRRRHGHQVRQRRADGPVARRQVLARVLRHAVRGDRRLGGRRRTATRSRKCRRRALLEDGEKLLADYIERTGRPMNHVRNFFDCVKSRQQTVANPDVMHHSMSTVHAANICMWLKRDLKYDPVKEEFVSDPEANRLRTRAQREPWIY